MELLEPESPNCFGGVRCLGHANGDNHFITRRGEYRTIPSTALEQGIGILDLFAAPGWSAVDFLAENYPSRARPTSGPSWDKRAAGADLIQRSAEAGFHDKRTQMRSYGTWRLNDDSAVAHCGERIVFGNNRSIPAGCRLGGAIFTAFPQRPPPAERPADIEETWSILESIRSGWGFDRPTAADVFIGWIGAAALGGFPRWRTHLMVSGRRGSGKTRLVELADKLLGGMSDGVLNDSSEAGIRQSANGQARALLFDEAERDAEAGQPERIIRLFRLMSDAEGARVARGTAAHSAKEFNLVGAGYLSSILPARLAPQDRSRIVQLHLGPLPTDRDASAAAQHLEDLEEEARTLGPAIWRRMLEQSWRWDRTHRAYKQLIHDIGGESRDGDTIGTILTGWDLMLYDDWPENAEERRERLELARNVALPLMSEVAVARDEGEGESCLRHLLTSIIPLQHRGPVAVGELLGEATEQGRDAPDLGRHGLRYRPDEGDLLIAGRGHKALSELFRGTRWADGGHVDALRSLDGVSRLPNPVHIAGTKGRVLAIPGAFLEQ